MIQTKGFTLIELIIVIALIALLATTVILVINPAKILQEARDSQRIADLGQMNSAMSIFLASAAPTGTYLGGACATLCYTHSTGATANCGGRYAIAFTTSQKTSQKVDGTGWVPVNLGASPAVSSWPIDPRGNANAINFYTYACDDALKTWEFAADVESDRYKSGGTDDVENTDGGNNSGLFEVGTGVNGLGVTL